MSRLSILKWSGSMSAAFCGLLLGLAACSSVGPDYLRYGRGIYKEAITRTNNEQVLDMIVKGRYMEKSDLLAVASVTASLRVSGNASAEFGIGPDESFEGNLVPFQFGVAYEENPTITYVPVQGEQFLRELMSPLPLDLLLLLIENMGAPDEIFTLLIEGINGVRNDAFLPGTAQPDDRFQRIAELVGGLYRAGAMAWLHDDETKDPLFLFSDYEGTQSENLQELLSLLGLDSSVDPGPELLVPVFASVGRAPDQIRIQARSLYDLLVIAEASVDVPEEDVSAGRVKHFPPMGAVGGAVRIHRSESAPQDAAVAIQRGDWWYFIAAGDLRSKTYFRMIEALTSVLTSEASSQTVPILTLPVSG